MSIRTKAQRQGCHKADNFIEKIYCETFSNSNNSGLNEGIKLTLCDPLRDHNFFLYKSDLKKKISYNNLKTVNSYTLNFNIEIVAAISIGGNKFIK